MGYRIMYLQKGTVKRYCIRSRRLTVLTGIFFLLFCLYTKHHNPEYIMLLKRLLSMSAVLLMDFLESYLS